MTIVQKQPTATPTKPDEKILVVARKNLFAATTPQGFVSIDNFKEFETNIDAHKEFIWRQAAEQDPSYKQIIPYLVFKYQEKIFLMQRPEKAGEQRLKNKYTLGIGGHIREQDLTHNSIFEWSRREFTEEVNYKDDFSITPLGLVNDESNSVGQVHVGFVFLLEGSSDNISIRSELKHGSLLTIEECAKQYDNMETWSQLVFKHLEKTY
ncbi:MAG: hypothetical protein H6679_00815 [Epsilonproteobacteria bacterium]|nr:hypothetical protein [Campylobacterota bacterium]